MTNRPQRTLVAAGFPSSAPTGGGGTWLDPVNDPLLVTLVLVLLLGIGAAVVVLRRPRFRPAS